MNRAAWTLARLLTFFAWLAVFLYAACVTPACSPQSPAVTAYGAERLACVELHETPEAARACMREVDARFGQDGGLRP